jgi:hypothetical protein
MPALERGSQKLKAGVQTQEANHASRICPPSIEMKCTPEQNRLHQQPNRYKIGLLIAGRRFW